MSCFMIVIAVVIFRLSECVSGQEQVNVQDNDNSEQFALLCRIYNVAKNPPIDNVDLQDPMKVVKEIDALNASLMDPKGFNETQQVGNSSGVQLKPTTTREAAVAQALVRRITQKAHTILNEITKLNVSEEIEKVKAEFHKVIFGEGVNGSDLCHGALKDIELRGNSCGKPGEGEKGSHAGKNLVVDFFCLCAQRKDGEGIDNVCGVYVGASKKNGNHGWESECPSTSSTMWGSIKKGCGRLVHQNPKSNEEGREVLKDFLKNLETGGLYRWGDNRKVNGRNRREGMLGTGVGKEASGRDIVCDGKRGGRQLPGGICVYYGNNDWEENIDWLKKLSTALNAADTMNNKTATIQRDIEKLHTLLHRAEQIYDTTKVITEIQQTVVPTNPQTAAKRLTAYNAVRRHRHHTHSILLFVLL
ncbi:Variant surface glycoprotein [Trypanosoma congolense IL3000]|uniref:Variant surface glycoprotein n=1 Tax=Trypanosoma congolense (strain IL3000) TaxID=1068625 RepID=F9W8K2_TRYCI|nr:Variant surface glycoprotein [Trypanosoma congolense IL3000]